MAIRRVFRTHTSGTSSTHPASPAGPETTRGIGAGGGGTLNVGAGGGGAFAEFIASGTPTGGATYNYVIGAGAANTDGTDTTYNSTSLVAKGGKSGLNGGAGGTAAASTGTSKQTGGNGHQAVAATCGGGGAASLGGDGGNGGLATAGDGGGKWGGRGTASANPGNTPGGGGRCTVAAATAGGRGELRYAVDTTVDTTFARCQEFDELRASANLTTIPLNWTALTTTAHKRVTILMACDGNPTLSIADTTWEKLGQQDAPGSTHTLAVFSKYCPTNETSVTATSTASEMATVHVWVDEEADKPELAFETGASGANPNQAGLTRADGVSRPCLWRLAVAWDAATGVDVSACPSGYEDGWRNTPVRQGAGVALSSCHRYNAASSENPAAWGATDQGSWVAATLSYARVSDSRLSMLGVC